MKRLFCIAVAALTIAGCTFIRDLRTDEKPYDNPFYAKYLNTGSTLDANINRTLDALRANPESPELHNTLGALLVEKRFPADAEREFERAINEDSKFFPAWYNLGLVRASRGDEIGARRAFARTIDLKPGHAPALFQLGLIEEKREHRDRAVELYAKAFAINPALMQVQVNPRILDTKLTHLALLRLYPDDHARKTMQFQGTPPMVAAPSVAPAAAPAPAPAPAATPAPAVIDPGTVQPAPTKPRPARPRRTTTPPPPATPPVTNT